MFLFFSQHDPSLFKQMPNIDKAGNYENYSPPTILYWTGGLFGAFFMKFGGTCLKVFDSIKGNDLKVFGGVLEGFRGIRYYCSDP